MDKTGNVFVTGWSIGSGTTYDHATIAYSSVGKPFWTNRYNGPANDDDRAYAIAVDASNHVFVTGNSFGGGGLYDDYLTIAYSNTGLPAWTNHYKGELGLGDNVATAIAVDNLGDVVVTGYSANTNIANYDIRYAKVKYSGAGVPLWTNRYRLTNSYGAFATAIVVDNHGNVFVTGNSFFTNGADYATVAYSSAGVPLWTNRYNGTGDSDDHATAIAVDKGGNVFVTGASYGGIENSYDYITIAYTSAGIPLWPNRYNGAAGFDEADDIGVDCYGNVFVTGRSVREGESLSYDYATIKYSLTVPLSIQIDNDQPVLSWTNAAFGWTNLAFALQSAPAITGTFTNIPGATSPYTNPITGPQQFFRLISNRDANSAPVGVHSRNSRHRLCDGR